jgi:hypothetical protein
MAEKDKVETVMEPAVTPEYLQAVTNLADKEVNRRFLNDSSAHAKLLACLMIGRTKVGEDALIYSGGLGKGVFDDAFKDAQGSIRVLLDSGEGIEIIKSLPDEVKRRIEVKKTAKASKNHFFVAGNSFRYELNHDSATAVANFNEPETVAKLQTLFNTMWNQSTECLNPT